MKRTLLERFLLLASHLARRFSALVLLVSLVAFVGSLYLAAEHLDFRTDRSDLISSKDALYEVQERYLKEFPESDDVVVLVGGGEALRRQAYVDLLASLLDEHPETFHAVFPRLEMPFLINQALQFLDEEELKALVDSVEEAKPFLKRLSSSEGFGGLLATMQSPSGTAGTGLDELAGMLPMLIDIIEELRRAVDSRGRADYRSPWGSLFFSEGESELAQASSGEFTDAVFYHTLQDGRVHLLLLRLADNSPESIHLLRKLVLKAGKAFPELSVGLTGEMILEHDEMVSSERDSHRSAVLSLLLVGLLFAIAFRQTLRPLAAIFCLALGVGWTLGYTTLVVGHLNLLTISFATILIGLGIDFGIHLLFRYEEEFAKWGETDRALDEALLGTGSDITVGAVSTATAFWAVGFTDFKGVSEIGVIAGGGVILCLISTLLVLPALIAAMDRKRTAGSQTGISMGSRIFLARAERKMISKAPYTLVGLLLFLIFAAPTVLGVGFDYNLLRLQDPSLDSVMTELELIDRGGKTVLFSVALADDIEHARVLKERFEQLESVGRVESVSELFPPRTEAKVQELRRLQALMADLEPPDPTRSVLHSMRGADLKRLGEGFLALQEMFEAQKSGLMARGTPEIQENLSAFEDQLERLFGELSGLGPGPIEDGLTTFGTNFLSDLASVLAFLKAQDPNHDLQLSDLPENLLIRSVGTTGKLVVRIYPEENVWEREALDHFVSEVRAADPQVVGAPVMIWHHTSVLKEAFETSGLYALVAVSLMLLLYFRSIKWALLALLPLGLGIFIMLFAMGLTGVSFNPANFMGLPLLLGIGLDFGIHVLHRVKQERTVTVFNHSTGPATALSALTTMCGFGTLALGGHQGISSLGFILAVGVGGIMFSALVILPAFLKVWSPFEKDLKEQSEQATETEAQSEQISA